jgi:uncharacterized YccA/Bax inhibitor family protein
MWSWNVVFPGSASTTVDALPSPPGWLLMGAPFIAFILAMVTIFKAHWAPISAPLYALFEGLFLGTISAMFEVRYPGIAMQAAFGTLATLGGLLMAYRTGLIKPTENFRLGLFAATSGIMMLYLISFVMGLFGGNMPFIHESGLMGIGFSLFVVVIAALNLVLDFDFIENGETSGAPQYMEWYGAFGLMVTLVWLYIEMLRLLAKLRNR